MPVDFAEAVPETGAVIVSIDRPWAEEDNILVAGAKRGNSQAFEVLVERHRRRILRTALCITRNLEDAEDIVQQTFEKAFVHLPQFEGKSSFSTWLTRIGVNEACMLLRSRHRPRGAPVDESKAGAETSIALEIPDPRPNPESSFSQQERRAILFSAMRLLPPEMRTAVQLIELEGLTVKEAARIMGISLAAAKSRLHRGRRKLREVIGSRTDTRKAEIADPAE